MTNESHPLPHFKRFEYLSVIATPYGAGRTPDMEDFDKNVEWAIANDYEPIENPSNVVIEYDDRRGNTFYITQMFVRERKETWKAGMPNRTQLVSGHYRDHTTGKLKLRD